MKKNLPKGAQELMALVTSGRAEQYPLAYRNSLREFAENEDFDWVVRLEATRMFDRLVNKG